MNTSTRSVFAGLCAILALTVCAFTLSAQTTEVKEKPAMYSYVANWQVPRAHWAEFEKTNDDDKPILEKALADGTIVGYGNDENLIHQPEAETHDDWWSATSLAGLLKVLDQFSLSGNSSSSVLSTATKHWDSIYVSHYYNWKPGAFKGGYTHVSEYKLKADAPDDAVDLLAKHMVVPILDKLVADGTVTEYEIDETAIHTSAPGTFLIVYITPTPEGLDTVQAAVRESLKAHPLSGDAFGSFVDDSGHRDELLKSNGVFK
jgi:hypothetical protein